MIEQKEKKKLNDFKKEVIVNEFPVGANKTYCPQFVCGNLGQNGGSRLRFVFPDCVEKFTMFDNLTKKSHY